jgi:hypothetical protein
LAGRPILNGQALSISPYSIRTVSYIWTALAESV